MQVGHKTSKNRWEYGLDLQNSDAFRARPACLVASVGCACGPVDRGAGIFINTLYEMPLDSLGERALEPQL